MGIILASTGLPLLTTAKGSAAWARAVEIAPEPEPKPEPPEPSEIPLLGPTTAISYRGVTFSFSKPVKYLESANGDPVVITRADLFSAGTTITSITPAGRLNGGLKINGTMKNHADAYGYENYAQGYDGGPGQWPEGWRRYAYDNAKNIDPGNTGSPIAIAQGESCSIIKSVRDPGASNGTWNPIQKYVVLTCMGSPPLRAGTWFRPNVSTTKKSWPDKSLEEMDFLTEESPLRHLRKPGSIKNPSEYLTEIEKNCLETMPVWVTTYEGRALQLRNEPGVTNGYATQFGRNRGAYACSLFIDQPKLAEHEARKALAAKLIQWGIDCDGAHQVGMTHSHGAGQWYGYLPSYYLAAFMLSDAGMLARAKAHFSNIIGQCWWVEQSEVGMPVIWDWGSQASTQKHVGETYYREMIGLPEWSTSGWQRTDLFARGMVDMPGDVREAASSNPNSGYRDSDFTTHILELMPIALLRNGPKGRTGIEEINRIGIGESLGGAVGPGNPASASMAYMDRSRAMTPDVHGFSIFHNHIALSAYDTWRDEIPQARWTGAPTVYANQKDCPNFTNGSGPGAIAWSLNGVNHSSGRAITGRELEISQDGIQFVQREAIGTASTHTYAGLRPGTVHWCRWRQSNAAGTSAWSPTWEKNLSSGGADALYKTQRGKVTSGGSAPSAKWVNAVVPALCHKPYPLHAEMPYYEPAPASPAVGTKLYAGIGYWTGGSGSDLSSAASYQWQRNGSNIGGATSQSYSVQAGDRGSSIRCVVTVGGVPATSTAVSIS